MVLAEVGSFVQAAAALFLTQPALTRSIHALEEELGGALFDRLGRRISLTPFGDEVLAAFAARLVALAPDASCVASIEGDGFLLVLPGVGTPLRDLVRA